MIVIPAIDLRGGRCVRLHQGRFDRETRYDSDPLALARSYADAGATRLHVVDLDGARDGGCAQTDMVLALAGLPGLAVQAGGGIRNDRHVARLLDGGVDRVVIGSLAVTEADTVRGWIERYGKARFVLALDVRLDDQGVPRIATRGWQDQTGMSLWDTLDAWRGAADTVLCTDIARDGAMQGPNADLYATCASRYPELAFQASGGIRHARDLNRLAETGAAGAVTGKALLEGKLDLAEISPFLQDA